MPDPKNSLLYCCSLCLCNSAISFLYKVIVHKPVFYSTFKQRIAICMRMCTPNNGDRNYVVKQPTFGHISFVTCFILVNNPFIDITFSSIDNFISGRFNFPLLKRSYLFMLENGMLAML